MRTVICLQIPAIFCIGEKCFSQLLYVQRLSNTAEPLVLETSFLPTEIVIPKLKIYKSSDTEQIAAELFEHEVKR
jgi:hypothetical protein